MAMINEQTIEKMRKMKMNHLAQILMDLSQNEAIRSLTFEEKVGLLIDTEWDYRQNNRVSRLIREAGLIDIAACIEGINYRDGRNINREQIYKLSTCDYIRAHQDILILGTTGTGKSYLSCALGNAACRNRITTRYISLVDMFDELALAAEVGALSKAIDSFIKPSLLILDDCFLTRPSTEDAERLLKLVEKRMHVGSTIYCSQLQPKDWHERISEKIVADAICDRIVHRCHVINLEGESMRKSLKVGF